MPIRLILRKLLQLIPARPLLEAHLLKLWIETYAVNALIKVVNIKLIRQLLVLLVYHYVAAEYFDVVELEARAKLVKHVVQVLPLEFLGPNDKLGNIWHLPVVQQELELEFGLGFLVVYFAVIVVRCENYQSNFP